MMRAVGAEAPSSRASVTAVTTAPEVSVNSGLRTPASRAEARAPIVSGRLARARTVNSVARCRTAAPSPTPASLAAGAPAPPRSSRPSAGAAVAAAQLHPLREGLAAALEAVLGAAHGREAEDGGVELGQQLPRTGAAAGVRDACAEVGEV